ncbi:hypothetical protein HF888_08340 [Bermanella marisrubri]|nr:hypothetical protein [Bermanella marisrubri]QIZ84236.1 hypothetical protein HF888_08340 [Bermanella marisrubri]
MSMSISLVRKELESTLQKAEGYFAQYAEDNEPGQLKLFADELNLARGTFKLLEMQGAELLCTEIQSFSGDGSVKLSQKLDVLGQCLITLKQYLGVVLDQETEYPVLLIPSINKLRRAAGHKPISEAHFFAVNLRPRLPETERPNINIKPHLPRIRLMFQSGLLRVIRAQASTMVGYKLSGRSLALMEKGFRGTMAWPFWWCASAALQAIVEGRYELTQSRAALLARIDQTMKAMIKNGLNVFSTPFVNEVHKDLLYLISLSSEKSGDIAKIQQVYGLKAGVTEDQLKIQRKKLAGPDIGAFTSLSKAVKDQIGHIKTNLDKCANGYLSEVEFDSLNGLVDDLARVLKVINQEPLSEKLRLQGQQIRKLEQMPNRDKMVVLAAIADALLQIELASQDFSKATADTSHKIIGAGHYSEARIILFDEIESALAMAKRAIAAFVEDQDKLHLANIKPALDGARGALFFLQEYKASSVVQAATRFLNERVLNNPQGIDEGKLEVLADSLTSIEYYAETLSHSDSNSADILNLAVKGISQLGYKVA